MTAGPALATVRPVLTADLAEVRRLIDRDPVAHCFLASRLDMGTERWRLGGDLLGYYGEEGLESAIYLGANLVPLATHEASRAAFADRLRRLGRRCSSMVGLANEVLDLWRLLAPSWGPAREVRDCQPLLVIDHDPRVAADPAVTVTRAQDLDTLLPACVAMFTGEVGISPVSGGMAASYRARIAELIEDGRSYSRIEGDTVVFKAEIGAASDRACQVQGVWVDPGHRGRGLSEEGMAAVVVHARQVVAPVVSLYVNDFNIAARRAYEAVGFREHDRFATVLF